MLMKKKKDPKKLLFIGISPQLRYLDLLSIQNLFKSHKISFLRMRFCLKSDYLFDWII